METVICDAPVVVEVQFYDDAEYEHPTQLDGVDAVTFCQKSAFEQWRDKVLAMDVMTLPFLKLVVHYGNAREKVITMAGALKELSMNGNGQCSCANGAM